MLFGRYRSTYVTLPSAFSVKPEARLPAIHFHVVWPTDLDLAIQVSPRALRAEPEARARHGNGGRRRRYLALLARVRRQRVHMRIWVRMPSALYSEIRWTLTFHRRRVL